MAGSSPQYSEPYPDQPTDSTQEAPAAAVYPGMLPPAVPYPKRRRWRVVAVSLAAVLVVAGVAAAVVYGARSDNAPTNLLNSVSAKSAIQGYVDALAEADVDTISRNTLCGMYDAVRDKRSDHALAKLSSEAFRKQFNRAEVTSVDKVVYWSPNQAQVLFTMRVTPSARGAQNRDEQGIAQVLAQDNRVLVCSYLLRTATVY
jgi:hypothetical protein